jgi:hypothetical protein
VCECLFLRSWALFLESRAGEALREEERE